MTRMKLEGPRRNESIRLPFDERESTMDSTMQNDPLDDSTQTLVNTQTLKSVRDEFLHFVRSQDSLSQLSFTVNDSAGDKTFDEVYDMGKVLGEGGFALVYQCRHRINNRTYAVKEIIKKDHSNGDEIKQEIVTLRRIKESPYFVRLLDVFEASTTTYLIMEEMKGGDLLDKLAEIEVFEEWEARKVARTLLEAVAYCHKRRIAHRDIKPENILLPRADDITLIKLADFGCAKHWEKDNEMQTLCGSPQYVAPEVVGDTRKEGEGYNAQCDLWSCGVVLYIMLGGYAPFESEDEHELLDLICEAEYEFHDEFWSDVEETPKQLISRLLVADPKQRLTARQALRSPWLRRRDRDWVEEMDCSNGSTSTFGKWLEKRSSSARRVSLNGSGHNSPQPTPSEADYKWDPSDSNRSLTNWDIQEEINGNGESRSYAEASLLPGLMQDSSNANVFNLADSCAE